MRKSTVFTTKENISILLRERNDYFHKLGKSVLLMRNRILLASKTYALHMQRIGRLEFDILTRFWDCTTIITTYGAY